MNSAVNNTLKPVYTRSNFPSWYLSRVHPNAEVLLHGGEVDIAIQSLSRPSASKVMSVDVDPYAVAIAHWKKQALKELSWEEYATFMSLFFTDNPYKAELFPGWEGPEYEERIVDRSFVEQIRERVERRLPEPYRSRMSELANFPETSRPDNGIPHNLRYLVRSVFERVQTNADKLEIIEDDVFEVSKAMGVNSIDMISLNNVYDWLATQRYDSDLEKDFGALAKRFREEGRLVIGSQSFRDMDGELYIVAYETSSGFRPPIITREDPTFRWYPVLRKYSINGPEGSVERRLSEIMPSDLVKSDDEIIVRMGGGARRSPTLLPVVVPGFLTGDALVEVYKKATS